MASYRQCSYCKASFPFSQFQAHLKQCRQKKQNNNSNPAPLQPLQPQPPSYNQAVQGGFGGGFGQPVMGGMGAMGGFPQPPMQGGMQPMGGGMGGMQPPMGGMGAMGGGGNAPLWNCPICSFQNSPSAAVCTMCQQSPRPANVQPPPQQAPLNKPPMYGGFGGGGGAPQGGQANGNQFSGGLPPPQPDNNKDAYWECQSCTFVNSVMSTACKICSNPQPKGANNASSDNKKKPPPNNMNVNQPPPPNQYGQPPQQQMYGQPKPPPPPPQQRQPVQQQQPPHNHMMNNNNGNGPLHNPNMSPPPLVDPMMNKGGGGGMGGMAGMAAMGGGSAEEADEATMALIRQMMEAEMCVLCKKQQGFELPCQHNVCGPCVKKYILNGIATMKWKKQALACPNPSGCKEGVIPQWVLKECGLGIGMQKKVEEMQNKFMIESDPTITSCPKCKETYSTETGDMQSINQSEKGPDGKPLQYKHIQHKAKYRFRCSKEHCKTIFCSGCLVHPYHVGYTCQEYQSYKESKKCRFCEKTLDHSNMAPKDFTLKQGLDNVCNDAACLEKRRWSCDEVMHCGHNCIGLMGHECIPCMNPKCLPKGANMTDEEFCNICWVDPLRMAPCVKLGCGHFFHFMCLWQKIDRKWPAARITFGFLNCPLCKQPIHHPALEDITKTYYDLKEEIQKDAVDRVKIEGLEHDTKLTDPNSPYYKNLEKYAMDRLAFYPCSKCKKPYFGGMKACEEAGLEQAENYKQEHLVCGSCASGPNAKSCKKHGKKYITYKCKFCCSVSSWYCWGSTHFCDSCHKKQEQGDYLNRKPISALPKCPGPDKCPLGIEHPANGTAEFSLGCVVCLRK